MYFTIQYRLKVIGVEIHVPKALRGGGQSRIHGDFLFRIFASYAMVLIFS